MGNVFHMLSSAAYNFTMDNSSEGSYSGSSSTSVRSFAPSDDVDLDTELRSTLFNVGYVLQHETLGTGTYAIVKTALCVQTQKPMAIKIIDRIKAPKVFIEHFLPRELDTVWGLDHPNIIKYHKVVHLKNFTCIIMEKAGSDLLDVVLNNKQGLCEFDIQKMLKGILLGVEYLHQRKIAHRDIKCENILLNNQDEIRVTDFGFARQCKIRRTRFGRKKVVKSDTFCGSHPYASPEVLSGTRYDPLQADMWSVGIVLFVLLTREFPFAESENSAMVLMQRRRQWCLPEKVEDIVSVKCVEMLNGLLEPNPKKRWTATKALNSSWMQERRPKPTHKAHSS